MRSLSPPVRRIAALGILLLVVLFAYLGIAQPVLDAYAAARSDAETLRSAIARAEAVSAAAGDMRQQLAQTEQQARDANGFLPTTSDALASASLQDLVKNAVHKARGDLRSTQILTAQDEGAARRVSVRVQFTADLAGVQRVFYELESIPLILFLNNVQITRQQAVPTARGTASSQLAVQFDIVGYKRGPG
jgi:general secretion pathway protein M